MLPLLLAWGALGLAAILLALAGLLRTALRGDLPVRLWPAVLGLLLGGGSLAWFLMTRAFARAAAAPD